MRSGISILSVDVRSSETRPGLNGWSGPLNHVCRVRSAISSGNGVARPENGFVPVEAKMGREKAISDAKANPPLR